MQRQHGLRPPMLSTSLHPSQSHQSAGLLSPHPLSAVSMASPLSPFQHQVPPTPIAAYNPNWFPPVTPIAATPHALAFQQAQLPRPLVPSAGSPSSVAPPPPYSSRHDHEMGATETDHIPAQESPAPIAIQYPTPIHLVNPVSLNGVLNSTSTFSPNDDWNASPATSSPRVAPGSHSSSGPSTVQDSNVYFPPPPGKSGRAPSASRIRPEGSHSRFKIGSVTIRNPIVRGSNTGSSPGPLNPGGRREQSQPAQPQPLIAARPTTIFVTPSSPVPRDSFSRRSASAGPGNHRVISPLGSWDVSPAFSAWPAPLPPPPPGLPPDRSPSRPSTSHITASTEADTQPGFISPPTRRPTDATSRPVPKPRSPPQDQVASESSPESAVSSQRGKLASLSINTNLSNPTITNLTNPPRAQDSAGTMAASKSLRRSTHVRELGRKSSRDGVADRRGSDPNRGQPKSLVSAPRFTGSTQEAGDQSHPTEGGDVTMPPNAGDYPSTRWKNSNTHEENRHPQSKRTSQTYVVPNSASSTSSFDQLPRRYKSSSNMSHASSNDTSLMSPTNDDSGAHPAPPVDAQSFFKSAAERHSVFIDRESRAKSDPARVELFAEFIVTESRIRRDRYATAIDSMGMEILELTRDLFRPQDPRRRFASPIDSVVSDWTKDSPDDRVAPQSIEKSLKRRRVIIPIRRSGSNEPSSGDSPASGAQHDASVAEKYRPTLSPIAASMISDAHDEMSSRGRQTVRWWESSQDGSSHNGGGTRGVERSKRESKYMGVNREEMELLQYAQSGPANYPAQYASYGVNEYPAEKQGSHEEDHSSLPTPQAPSTPKQVGLDISRLITLPPPYPRHHPAINNKHPDLAEIRNKARALGGPSELSDRLKAFTSELTEKHIANKKASAGRKARHLTDIRRQVELGEMSYAGAARAEADFGAAEELRAKQQPQQDFNDYQTAVLQDLHKLLTDRLAEACKPFDSLRREINSDAKAATANRPQEEGDERPELLEKLTLLKWLFDVREGLHAQLHALLSDRNDRYRHVILAQYAGAENAEKHGETEAFFAKDARDARVKHETEALARLQALVATVDKNVTHGADMNLSAFWDIAPGLNELCDQIPAASTRALRSSDFKLQIPAEERAENPAYERFPLQYLHSLLEHASRSAYQYIEAQVNLLCLLHEVKSGLSAARARLLEARRAEGGAGSEEGDEGRREREREERESKELTRELQEKVQMVEEQWREALGEKMRGIERQVRRALEEQGGWDEDREV